MTKAKNGKLTRIATTVAVIGLLIVAGKVVHSDGKFKGETNTGIAFLKETTGRIEDKVDILLMDKSDGVLITKKEE